MPSSNHILLEMKSIVKDFPGVRALDHINFELKRGEVHALVGEKSGTTLMSVLGGVHTDYQGQIFLDGRLLRFSNPKEAITQGIGIIYQELDLVPEFSVGENIVLGTEPTGKRLGGFGLMSRRRIFAETKKLLTDLGFHIAPHVKVGTLSVGEQQLVQIVKAIRLSAQVLVMDEPTARLAYHETETLFKIIHALKNRGISIIYISHHMEEILRVAYRVTVLRDGKVVGTVEGKTTPGDHSWLWEKSWRTASLAPRSPSGKELMSVKGLRRKVSFKISAAAEGEILGIGGLVGSGRSETAPVHFGADQPTGENPPDGIPFHAVSLDAIRKGIIFCAGGAQDQGLLLNHSVSPTFHCRHCGSSPAS
jgi:ribose transport system ATP-binding protein